MRNPKPVPKYIYFCAECKKSFETKHSLQEECIICELCGKSGSLVRRPSTIFITKKDEEFGVKTQAGELVTTTIEESKQELVQEKARLKNRVHKG